jgi:hypothetical protein
MRAVDTSAPEDRIFRLRTGLNRADQQTHDYPREDSSRHANVSNSAKSQKEGVQRKDRGEHNRDE